MTKDQLDSLTTLAECTLEYFRKYEPEVRLKMASGLCHILTHVILNSAKQALINQGKPWKMDIKKEIKAFVEKQNELLEEGTLLGKEYEDFLWKGRKLENENA